MSQWLFNKVLTIKNTEGIDQGTLTEREHSVRLTCMLR